MAHVADKTLIGKSRVKKITRERLQNSRSSATPATKRKPGRPRKITAELEAVLFHEISEGKTIRDACASAGVSFQSVAVLRGEDEAFRERLARAYLHGSVFSLDDAEHRLRTSTPKRIAIDREIAHHARWRASRLLPQFRDKLGISPEAPTEPLQDRDTMILEVGRRMAFAMHRAGLIQAERDGRPRLPPPASSGQGKGSESTYEAAPQPSADMDQSTKLTDEAKRAADAAERTERIYENEVAADVRRHENAPLQIAANRYRPRTWRR